MFYSDMHIHSDFSFDAHIPIEIIINKAIKKGIKEIAFVEHYDYREDKYIIPLLDLEKYQIGIKNLQIKYKNKIKILFGLELGLQPYLKDTIENNIKNYNFDFIIGSIHVVKGIDFTDSTYFKYRNKKEAYNEYFEEVLKSVKTYDYFDVCGHLDFIKRYATYKERELNYKEHSDIIDEILKVIINRGKGIEVNTSGFRYNLNCFHPNKDILKRYKELGGEIITIGSDSHNEKDLSQGFKIVYDSLIDLGYKYFTSYENRNPKFIEINKFIR